MWEEKSLMNRYDFQLSVYIIHLFHCLIFSAIRIFLYLQIPVLPNVSSIDTTKKTICTISAVPHKKNGPSRQSHALLFFLIFQRTCLFLKPSSPFPLFLLSPKNGRKSRARELLNEHCGLCVPRRKGVLKIRSPGGGAVPRRNRTGGTTMSSDTIRIQFPTEKNLWPEYQQFWGIC